MFIFYLFLFFVLVLSICGFVYFMSRGIYRSIRIFRTNYNSNCKRYYIESDVFVVQNQDLLELSNLINIPKGQNNFVALNRKNNNKRGNFRITQYFKVGVNILY